MKKIVIGLLLMVLLLVGCGIFNLSYFVTPDDLKFDAVVVSLSTPVRICYYMWQNFTYTTHILHTPSPYTLWKIKEGDCNDFSTFGVYIANYHGYETYQIHISLLKVDIAYTHAIAVYVEDGKYTYSSNRYYKPIYVDTFGEIIGHWEKNQTTYQVISYKVYDYGNNLIEEVNNESKTISIK